MGVLAIRCFPAYGAGYAGALHWRRAELGPSLACGQTHYLSIHRGLLRSRAVSAPDAARWTERNRLFGEDELQVLTSGRNVGQPEAPPESFARAVAFAISQPEEVDVNEILVSAYTPRNLTSGVVH
jgi:hypothetical protein